MDPTLKDAVQPIAENIFAQASVHSEMLEDKIGVNLPDEQFNKIFQEFVALLLHVSLRATFDLIEGGEFVNLTYAWVNVLGTSCSLSERHPNPPFINRKENMEIVGVDNDLLDKRHSEYAKHANLFGNGELNEPNTVTWQFAKHVSDIIAKPTKELDIQKAARTEAVTTYGVFIPFLRKFGLNVASASEQNDEFGSGNSGVGPSSGSAKFLLKKDVATLLLLLHGQVFSDESLTRIAKSCEITFANENEYSRALWEWFNFGLYAVVRGIKNNFGNRPEVEKAIVRAVFSQLHSHLVKGGFTGAELDSKLVAIKERFAQFDAIVATGDSERVGHVAAGFVLGMKLSPGRLAARRQCNARRTRS